METFIILTNLELETYLNEDLSIFSQRATSLEKMEESALHHFQIRFVTFRAAALRRQSIKHRYCSPA